MPRSGLRVGICFFIESNLGGAATQAVDLVTAAQRLGHEACLLRFTMAKGARGLWDYRSSGLPQHKLHIGRTGMRLESARLLLSSGTLRKAIAFISSFDLLLFVGGCPHITRTFTEEDFQAYYRPLYTEGKARRVMFFTDPFWQKLYPYCKDVAGDMDAVYAFAEAYRRIVVSTGLREDVGICNFGSVAAYDRATVRWTGRKSKNVICWPHQWRSWKNPDLFIRMAPHLTYPVNAYADGIEYHKLRRDRWKNFKRAVKVDHMKDENLNPEGKITIYGTVPQQRIMDEFSTCRWMIDLTGMSGRTGKPLEKFVGNYQCVNMESMMLGCANFKYENTIHPHSQIPKDCVLPLPLTTDPEELADHINEGCRRSLKDNTVGERGRKWALARFNPMQVFEDCFIKPFE